MGAQRVMCQAKERCRMEFAILHPGSDEHTLDSFLESVVCYPCFTCGLKMLNFNKLSKSSCNMHLILILISGPSSLKTIICLCVVSIKSNV